MRNIKLRELWFTMTGRVIRKGDYVAASCLLNEPSCGGMEKYEPVICVMPSRERCALEVLGEYGCRAFKALASRSKDSSFYVKEIIDFRV